MSRFSAEPKMGHLRALVCYFKDPRASVFGKLVVVFAVAYAIMPLDAIPDALPILGWLDDIGVMGLATAWLWHVVGRYRHADEVPSASLGVADALPPNARRQVTSR